MDTVNTTDFSGIHQQFLYRPMEYKEQTMRQNRTTNRNIDWNIQLVFFHSLGSPDLCSQGTCLPKFDIDWDSSFVPHTWHAFIWTYVDPISSMHFPASRLTVLNDIASLSDLTPFPLQANSLAVETKLI